jgi:endonuclease/exonuclease/phosphatase family metal-dependent hydrolase
MDLIALVAPGGDFDAKVVAALEDRAASRPAERARALAALIHKRGPALVGLQEVYRFTCKEFPQVADGKGCDNPAIVGAFTDQLEDTLAALRGRYREAATVVNLDLPDGLLLAPSGDPLPVQLPGVPIQFDGMTIYIGVVDRDVILARTDVPTEIVPFTALCPGFVGDDGCNYQLVASATLTVTVPGFGAVPVIVKFQRGFVGVDATVAGAPYRFVTTHLETRLEGFGPEGRFYQSGQAAELLGTLQFAMDYLPPPAGTRLLVVGDMNSDPRDETYPGVPPGYPEILAVPPYQQFTMLAKFTDAWTKQPATPKGKGAPLSSFTCCQWEDLSNVRSDLYERIDLIFSAAPIRKVPDAKLLGESIGDKTLPKAKGLWPSDHASVAARIQY